MRWGTNYNNTGFDGAFGYGGEGVSGQDFMRRKDNLHSYDLLRETYDSVSDAMPIDQVT